MDTTFLNKFSKLNRYYEENEIRPKDIFKKYLNLAKKDANDIFKNSKK